MNFMYILLCINFAHITKSADIESYEINRVEFTPLHDSIIYKDIADVINEFENDVNPRFNTHMISGSASEEDIDDLLSEYLHYLDKAHSQRVNYDERTKSKNKVPHLRLDKYSKIKPTSRNNYDNHKNYMNSKKYLETPFVDPFNLFVPYNFISTGQKAKFQDKAPPRYDLPNSSHFSRSIQIPISPMCYCKNNEINCKCGCKQCFIASENLSENVNKLYDKQNIYFETYPKNSKYPSETKPLNNIIEDKLNIRIKIDVQYPELTEPHNLNRHRSSDKITETDGTQFQEMITSINLPLPYINFPIPIELQRTNINKHLTPIRKMTIHKKKKSHSNINNKKHTTKRIISFHAMKLNPQSELNKSKAYHEFIEKNSSYSYNPRSESITMQTTIAEKLETMTHSPYNNTVPLAKNISNPLNDTYSTEHALKKSEDHSERLPKIENSIETDFVEKSNNSFDQPIRLKRENLIKDIIHSNQSMINNTKETKKFGKASLGEIELLYWPLETKNQTLSKSKNITSLILEREGKKSKLNMSDDLLRSNRTMALEKAIFGDVDWNDVDSVAPVFISFIGKYIRGILTFCSQSICHSMKCAEKVCIHRSCLPNNRYNNKGHCSGNNDTDSLAGMESIMDLPSNIAFEIVDILQDKMIGKMFGKATLCITSKCVTFVASKKLFQRSKCISKELSSSGHCPNVKNVKVV